MLRYRKDGIFVNLMSHSLRLKNLTFGLSPFTIYHLPLLLSDIFFVYKNYKTTQKFINTSSFCFSTSSFFVVVLIISNSYSLHCIKTLYLGSILCFLKHNTQNCTYMPGRLAWKSDKMISAC